MQAAIPDRHDQVGISDGQSAGQVNGICAAERVRGGELAGVLLYGRGELDRSCSCPVLLPHLPGAAELALGQIVAAACGSQCGAYLGVGQPARHRSVTSIPQCGREVASGLFSKKLHEGAGIEIHQRHRSAPIFADDVREGPPRPRPRRCCRALSGPGPADHSLGGQPFQRRRGGQAKQPCDWHSPVGNDDLVTTTSLIEPDAEIGPEFGDGDVHESKCTLRYLGKCTFVPEDRPASWAPGAASSPLPARTRLNWPASLVHPAQSAPARSAAPGRDAGRLG
jgi:hypothetical protein